MSACRVHPVLPKFLGIAKTSHRYKGDPVIGTIVRHPGRHLIPQLHLGAHDKRVPRDHLIQAASFHL
jgi:hypothetical protein